MLLDCFSAHVQLVMLEHVQLHRPRRLCPVAAVIVWAVHVGPRVLVHGGVMAQQVRQALTPVPTDLAGKRTIHRMSNPK